MTSAPSPMLASQWRDHKDYVLPNKSKNKLKTLPSTKMTKSSQKAPSPQRLSANAKAAGVGACSHVLCSPKLDGFRCVGMRRGLYSRNCVRFNSCGQIRDAVQQVLTKRAYAGRRLVLDGELFSESKDVCFERILTALKKSEQNCSADDVKLQQELRYHVFDIIDLDDPEALPFTERNKIVQDIISADNTGLLVPVPQYRAKTELELENHMDMFLSQSFEGLVARVPDGKYEIGKRSHKLLKYVPIVESEFDVYAVKEGEGKFSGTVGALCCTTPLGKKFSASPGVDDATRRFWWDNRRALVGKKVTVQYQRLGAGGLPRFPIAKAIRNFMRMRV
eukprot:PhM_4_TR11911/c0_g1_i1/m.80102/K10747/LIG1; DNA ligase 1